MCSKARIGSIPLANSERPDVAQLYGFFEGERDGFSISKEGALGTVRILSDCTPRSSK